MEENNKEIKSKNKKIRIIVVIAFLIIFAIYLFVAIRGDYLQALEIGEQYVGVFKQNLKYKTTVMALNFIFLYIVTYITTVFIKKGLKKFFDDDQKEMPKLPNKSLSLIIAIIVSVLSSGMITEKAMLAINSTFFGITDPVFNLDISFYMFQKPFIDLLVTYFIGVMIGLSVYIAAYYIIVFNIFFDKGIDIEVLKKNTFIKQLVCNLMLIVIAISISTFLGTYDILTDKFLSLSDGTGLIGAGLTDTTIKVWGYRILSLIIIICAIISVRILKASKSKKIVITIAIIPAYLILLFIITLGFDLIYVKRNELDKEKTYIEYNIDFTKNAYNINIEEIDIETSGTITAEDIEENQDVIDNVNIIKKETTLATLEEYQTSSGYYIFKNTATGVYKINNKKALVQISPREIISNETRTYNNKTYEYTHGYGVIITDSTKTDSLGITGYIQKSFDGKDNVIDIVEPRIYFGLQTNEPIITNTKNKVEYDYPKSSNENAQNTYDGEAGLELNFLDRLILGIKEGNLRYAFSSNINSDSKIITKRNIIERAQAVMPYLEYEEEPYMVITDEGRLVWVIDAYTMSNNYPYAQETIVELNSGFKKKINYIRNSVKVLVDSYDGTIEFYITDKTDPIAMAYKKIYPDLFLDKDLPEDIAEHIVYPEYLYNIQAEILKQYHNVTADVLYRGDDTWDISKENTKKVTSVTGTNISPYYTMVKAVDSDDAKLRLVIPYTLINKQNLTSYLVGTYDTENKETLKLYKFTSGNAVLGTIQLDTLIEENETISKELKALNTTGTKIEKNIIVVPINNTLLYVEPVYQVMLNESQVPVLKKVIVASGNKVAIGDSLEESLINLLSKQAVSIKVDSESIDELIKEIVNANNNLEQSNKSNDWEAIGRDMATLQKLIYQLETLINEEKSSNILQKTNEIQNTILENINN